MCIGTLNLNTRKHNTCMRSGTFRFDPWWTEAKHAVFQYNCCQWTNENHGTTSFTLVKHWTTANPSFGTLTPLIVFCHTARACILARRHFSL
ncbi:hypothetical protein PC116_g18957 [Phytophthora cactorum]|uniref:Uncharacterized protein n=1 Tax=Phytophthora cactorum TaxID=29920 RepID=A0A8T1KEZ4_9STRA|nr:hypothetical protein PC112_g14720 [Phytophthora cactorum]KAG2904885.1 hypothetical protein PC115_g14814 [Phytophthora cactorum]KAG2923895.1 hypothetical protein PC117_g15570 [Phytophthora cactorum]KAG2972961.1 hypothetical protein PC118_g15393 [Phytophthora cactorum]KAG3064145.1 hypothetical protein PC121_g11845 [Phytophthora cactorum]